MSTQARHRLLTCLIASMGILCGFATDAARAQGYPTQSVKIVVPFTAGGGSDVTARLLAEQLAPKLGQAVIVENRAGGSAAVGASIVANATPNGYTLLFGTATLATNSVIPGTKLGFDLLNDFEFIGKAGQIDLVVVTSAKQKIDDLRGLVNHMRSEPEKVQFGSPGLGAPAHLGGELLKQLTKTEALHVPYKGESAALADLIGGQTTFQLCATFVCGPRIKDGSLKGLAVTSKKRSKVVPSVPTSAEAGVPGFEANTWYFLAAPKGTPANVVAKLNASLNEVLADQKVKARLEGMGVETETGTTSASVKTSLAAEMDKWRPVVKAAGITN